MISWCLFWHADKHQSLLQVAINLGVHSQACPKYPKQVCLSLQYLQKKWVVKFLFCLQIKSWFLPAGKQKIVLQVDIIIWYYQYLSNISKKMLRMKLIFCLGINIKSFLKLIPSFLVCVCVWPDVCYFFAISYGRSWWWSWFFACIGAWSFLTNPFYGFDWDAQVFSKFPN